MLRLTGFTAELDMCGTTLKVRYASGKMAITGVTYDSAEQLLGILIAGEKTLNGAAKPRPVAEEVEKVVREKAPELSVAAPAVVVPAVVPEQPVARPQSVKEEKSLTAMPALPAEIFKPIETGDELFMSDLSKMQHFRDVISALMGRGVVEEAAIVAECEKLKDRVPIIKVIKDIPDRVHRTMSYLVSSN